MIDALGLTNTIQHFYLNFRTEVYLELTTHCETFDAKPLKKEFFVSHGNPSSHALVEGWLVGRLVDWPLDCSVPALSRVFMFFSSFSHLSPIYSSKVFP